jgi:sugar phosphate isomerase/epimerase
MGDLKFGVDLLTYEAAGYKTYDRKDAEKVLANLKKFGCDGVEPIGIPERMKEMKPFIELLKSYQLETIEITGIWGRFGSVVGTYPQKDPTSSDPKKKKNSVEYIKKCCEMALMFNTKYTQVALGSLEEQDLSPKGIERAKKNLIDVLRESSRYCKDRGVSIFVEPQCRFEGYYGVNSTMEQVLEVIDAAGADNLVPMLDTFHASIEERSIPGAIMKAGKRLGFVHATDSNRLPPGFGAIDFKTVISSLMAVGYSGYLSIESMPIGEDVDSKVSTGVAYLHSLYRLLK